MSDGPPGRTSSQIAYTSFVIRTRKNSWTPAFHFGRMQEVCNFLVGLAVLRDKSVLRRESVGAVAKWCSPGTGVRSRMILLSLWNAPNYSYRSAVIGSWRMARRAGA